MQLSELLKLLDDNPQAKSFVTTLNVEKENAITQIQQLTKTNNATLDELNTLKSSDVSQQYTDLLNKFTEKEQEILTLSNQYEDKLNGLVLNNAGDKVIESLNLVENDVVREAFRKELLSNVVLGDNNSIVLTDIKDGVKVNLLNADGSFASLSDKANSLVANDTWKDLVNNSKIPVKRLEQTSDTSSTKSYSDMSDVEKYDYLKAKQGEA